MIRDALPYYLIQRPELKDVIEKAGAAGSSLLFIEVLITDHQAHAHCRGAGAALVEAVKCRARAVAGKKNVASAAVYVDVDQSDS